MDILKFFQRKPRTTKQIVGARGEQAALKHLQKIHCKLIEKNWRKSKYEIDLVVEDKGTLVFVEVRTRSAAAKVSGYHSIGVKKRKILREGAFLYMRTLKQRPKTYRYDFIEIGIEDGKVAFLRHYKNADVF